MGTRSTQRKDVDVFPEYRELITRLKTENARFVSLFDKHNQLDQQISNLQKTHAPHDTIEQLKREKLSIKDELYVILKKADSET